MASLNNDFMEVFLQNFHTFQESGDPESRLFLLDINTALWNAPLTGVERSVIQRLYLEPPSAPVRDKLSKRGLPEGRPSGGSTQLMLSAELGIEKSTLSNIKKSAITKMCEFLGAEYDLD